jgi:hypothetical protein
MSCSIVARMTGASICFWCRVCGDSACWRGLTGEEGGDEDERVEEGGECEREARAKPVARCMLSTCMSPSFRAFVDLRPDQIRSDVRMYRMGFPYLLAINVCCSRRKTATISSFPFRSICGTDEERGLERAHPGMRLCATASAGPPPPDAP